MTTDGRQREGTGLSSVRLAAVLARTPLRLTGEPVLLASDSNEAWSVDDDHLGPLVLRICWRGDPERLVREAAVGLLLPAEVGYPEVVDAGRLPGEPDLTWTLTRRLEGETLGAAWPRLDHRQRREACRRIAELLQALHGWRAPRSLVPLLIPHPLGAEAEASAIIGRFIHPLPVQHAVSLLDHGRALGLGDGMVRRLRGYLSRVPDAVVPRLDDASTRSVIHSDLNFDNIWWDGREVAGMLDLEWVRLAPPYVELARLQDNVDDEEVAGVDVHRALYQGLRVDYPALFDVPRLDERIRLVQVVYQLRQLVALLPLSTGQLSTGQLSTDEPVPSDHPLQVLHRLLGD